MSEHEPTDYGREFYEWTDQAALTAAEIVVPTVLDMVDVTSVVDVGCGTGAWLRAFVDRGVTDILGIDTDRVPPDLLKIGRDRYMTADLAHPPTVGRNFDLAVSVEVAEHLPEEAADRFVAFLCSLAPVLLFSAAIPGQEGEAHLNEQWPSYWSGRFAVHGFESLDVVRPLIWDNADVPWFYRQNLLIYVRSTDRGRITIGDGISLLPAPPMALVHPFTFTSYRQRAERKLATPLSFSAHVRALPRAFRRALERRLRSAARGQVLPSHRRHSRPRIDQ